MDAPALPSPDLTRLSVAMIVKNETDTLEACLASFREYVDEIVVAWNGDAVQTREILEKYHCKVVPYTWVDDFSAARACSFEHTSNELVMWVDADDTVLHPENLGKLLAAFQDPRIGSVWLDYLYDFDEYGHPCMVVCRERIVRKSWWKWHNRIHEVMLPIRGCAHVKEKLVVIKHTVLPDRVHSSADRNLRISQKAYHEEKEKGDVDPRTIYDYARSLKATGNRKEAVEIFKEFIEKSDFDDDRYEALHSIADIYRKFRWYDSALEAEFAAMRLRPQRPEAYFGLAETYFCMEEWGYVVWFTELGYRCPPREDNMPIDPIALKARPLLPLHFALFQQAKFREALTTVQKALEFFPRNTYLLDCQKNYNAALEQEQLERSMLHVYDYLNRDGESDKLPHLAKAVPEFVKDHPVFVRLVNRFATQDGWRNKIVIYCGSSYELWDASSTKEGIGGSEEAVIHLAPLLVKLGWQVEIYNNCLEEGNYDGAIWKPFWTYDQHQPCAIFIAWRDTRSILLAPREAYCIAWMHDRSKPEHWSEAMIERVDRVFVLSNYHATDFTTIPNDKLFITANGINSHPFIALREPRDPKRCIYASSPDRGLDILLQNWPAIREKVPDAELHVFYGFTKTYDELHKHNQHMKEFRDTCLKLLQQPGVMYHGRVGHAQLTKEFLRSALWLYPTYFTEISCITAMKAQAAGAIPVTTMLAALEETVQYGYKISFSIYDKRTQLSFVQIVADLLNHPEKQDKIRGPMMTWAQQQFSWMQVAQQWDEVFKTCLTQQSSLSVS